MMVELTGLVIMPQEKLHVLFGLILMTQYFTSVTTRDSLSSSGKLLLSASLSPVSSTLPSQKSFSSSSSSLGLSISSNPSSSSASSSSLWPTSSNSLHRQLHDSTTKNFHTSLALVPMYHAPHHQHRNLLSGDVERNLFNIENIEDEEVPIIKISPRRSSFSQKHQKRHVGSGNDESSKNSTIISHHNLHNPKGEGSLTILQQSHPLITPHSSSSLNKGDQNYTSDNTENSYTNYTKTFSRRTDGKNKTVYSYGGSSTPKNGMCRFRQYMPPQWFILDTCAWCYKYMKDDIPIFGKPSKKMKTDFTIVRDSTGRYAILTVVHNGTKIFANVSDTKSPIWQSFANEEAKKDWSGCCHAARECCESMLYMEKLEEQAELEGTTASYQDIGSNMTDVTTPVERECPPTWDGWQCWNSTKGGIIAKSYCPNYIYFLTQPPTCSIPVDKECWINGSWARKYGNEWTNYAVCALSAVNIHTNRAYVLVTAYAISIVALVPAVIIFFTFKQLRVHRIILHQNLFFSLILNALLVIIFKTSVMMSETNTIYGGDVNSIVRKNSIGCRLLLISTKYSRMTNYMWMLCEGFYLHKLIAAAFAEQKSLLVFYLIGWVFPIFPVAFYAGYRMLAANEECWVVPQEEWEWALNGPSLLSLLVNTLFLINIIRVLVTKLRAAHAQEPSQYRKAVRATLVLLPLFGLHFIVTIYRPPSTTGVCQNWTELYFYANDILDGMQGFAVALIFCYFNGEVFSLLKRAYTRWKEQHFDVGHRRNSRHRPSRGSVLGRSVVSTHIYSSIPPSPETNVIAIPCGGSNSSSKDISPSTVITAASNVLTVNGSTGTVSSNVHVILNNSNNTTATATTVTPPNGKRSSLKKRKNNHTSATNGNAVNMYVSSEYGCVKENPNMEISCV